MCNAYDSYDIIWRIYWIYAYSKKKYIYTYSVWYTHIIHNILSRPFKTFPLLGFRNVTKRNWGILNEVPVCPPCASFGWSGSQHNSHQSPRWWRMSRVKDLADILKIFMRTIFIMLHTSCLPYHQKHWKKLITSISSKPFQLVFHSSLVFKRCV